VRGQVLKFYGKPLPRDEACRVILVIVPERLVACISLAALLPFLLFIVLVIHQMAGNPIIVADEMPSSDGKSCRRFLRFRTTGCGLVFFPAIGRFLRACSIDQLPALLSVARGDVTLRDFLRLANHPSKLS